MVKHFWILILSLYIPFVAFSQELEIDPLIFRKVKKEIKKKSSPYYYPQLFQRYQELDTSLTAMDFRYLYYGFSFQDDYRPYGTPSLRDSLVTYLQRQDLLQAELEVAARIAGELLRESPFRLRETFIAAVAYEMAGNARLSVIYFNYYEKQVEAIMSTGDGMSKNSAFAVIYIPDEYEILEVLGFNFSGSQSLIEGNYDLLEVDQNSYGITEIYFNVNRMIDADFE